MGAATVLEVTDHSVRVRAEQGRAGRPPRALVEAALDWIDDPVGLFDERPVAVADLWRSLTETLVGGRRDEIVVVHPADWHPRRVDRVVAAANTLADHVEAVSRDRWGAGMVGPEDGVEALTPHRRHLAAGLSSLGALVRRRRSAVAALLAGSAVVALTAVPAGRMGHPSGIPTGVILTEGPMSVRVPADWPVERVAGGHGSPRLQVSSPGDPGVALHLTWSYAPDTTLDRAAEVLARAMSAEPRGVFADLRTVEIGGRRAVGYRELRPGRVIVWSVVLAGATRISIGCQTPPGREAGVRDACAEAVASARET